MFNKTQGKKIYKPSNIAIFFFILFFVLSTINICISANDSIIQINSNNYLIHEYPAIAITNDTIHVVWDTQFQDGKTLINYSKSIDNSNIWSESIILSDNTNTAYYPVIAAYDSKVTVIWIDFRDDNSEIYQTRSVDNGRTWTKSERITFNSTRKTCIYDLQLKNQNNNLYLVWKDYRSGSSEIFFKKSTDFGITWDEDKRLTFDYTPSYFPSFTIKDDDIFIVYEDGGTSPDVYFLKSTDLGESWSDKRPVSSINSSVKSQKPDICISDEYIYCIWHADKTGEKQLYFSKSLDNGETWTEEKQLTFNSKLSINPKIFAYSTNISLFFNEELNGIFKIRYMQSNDSGESWGKPINISENDSYSHRFIVENNYIHHIWQEYTDLGIYKIMYHKNNDKINNEPENNTEDANETKEKNDSNIIDNKQDDQKTPGFEFSILILTTIILSLSYKLINKKKRK